MPDKVIVRIERSDGPGQASRWEEFHVERRPNANVISVLMQIQRNPVTAEGKSTTPPAWDAACLEEVCGSCTMVINGKVRQACSALIDKLAQPISLQPMKKFPLVRDLTVDRGKMFDALRRVRAWIPIDGTYDLGPDRRDERERTAARADGSRRRQRLRKGGQLRRRLPERNPAHLVDRRHGARVREARPAGLALPR